MTTTTATQTVKPIAAKDIQPGMRVRLVNALPGTAWDTYREVAKVHNPGIWRQHQIMLTDGDWATWTADTRFEVETAEDRLMYAVYAAIGAGAHDTPATLDDMPPLGTRIRTTINGTPTYVQVCGYDIRRGARVSNRMWGGTVNDEWIPLADVHADICPAND